MSLKISAVMNVFQAMEYFPYALRSIYDHVEEIVIFDGLIDQFNKDGSVQSKNGSSNDGTLEFVAKFPDPKKKIKLDSRRWKDEKQKRQAMMRPVTGNYIMIVDSDEVYKPAELQLARKVLAENPQVLSVWPRHYRFCGDFNRYYQWWGAVYQKCDVSKKLYGLREILYPGNKVFKYPHKECKNVTRKEYDKHQWIPGPKELVCYHYSNVCTAGKARRKKLISIGLNHRMTDWDKRQFGLGLGQKEYDKIRNLREFKGEHPEAMLGHPYFKNPPGWLRRTK